MWISDKWSLQLTHYYFTCPSLLKMSSRKQRRKWRNMEKQRKPILWIQSSVDSLTKEEQEEEATSQPKAENAARAPVLLPTLLRADSATLWPMVFGRRGRTTDGKLQSPGKTSFEIRSILSWNFVWLFTLVIDLKLKYLKEFGFRGLWGLLRALGAPTGLWNVPRVSEKKKR